MLDDLQNHDLKHLTRYLSAFWLRYAEVRSVEPITPSSSKSALQDLLQENVPRGSQTLDDILASIDRLIVPNSVKTSHPLFLGYVTPSVLDIASLGDAIAAILNQNVMFESLSPVGTAVESKVIDWLCHIVGYSGRSVGGLLVSGGSEANLYGLALARNRLLTGQSTFDGNYADARRMRVYCSEHAHHSVDKAAALLGIGTANVVHVKADDNHKICIDELEMQIERDLAASRFLPMVIVGSAGTRQTCAFDDLHELKRVSDRFGLWLHIDAAYGGFLRIARSAPKELQGLPFADSIAINPHKLLFVPFDCGCFLVRESHYLKQTFGSEGEYFRTSESENTDFASMGMQLGRAMKALKVWVTIKYIGIDRFGEEFTRLMSLARYLAQRITRDPRMQLLGPVEGTAVCFRWTAVADTGLYVDALNRMLRQRIVREGSAFIDETEIRFGSDVCVGIRVCMTNFRTTEAHIDKLMIDIEKHAEALRRR